MTMYAYMYKIFDICTKFTNFQRREYLQKYVFFSFKKMVNVYMFLVIITLLTSFLSFFSVKKINLFFLLFYFIFFQEKS